MPKKSPSKKAKKAADDSQKQAPFRRKKRGFRTPKPFRRKVFRRNPALTTQRPRSLGGHQ